MAKKTVPANPFQINPCVIDRPLNVIHRKHPALEHSTGSYIFDKEIWQRAETKSIIEDNPRVTELFGVETQIEEIRSVYSRGTEALAKFGGSKLPICYALQPHLKKLKKDDTSVSKFGGKPDMSNAFHLRYRKPRMTILDCIRRGWPRCGACHEYMAFVGQFHMGTWPLAIHLATAEEHDEYGRKLWVSSLGASENFYQSELLSQRWWQFFACMNSAMHFSDPNYNAVVILDRGPRAQKLRDEEWQQAKNAVDEFYKNDLVKGFLKIRDIYQIEKFSARMDVDYIKSGENDWETKYKIQDLMEKHPDIFIKSDIRFFGRPKSQQEERRYWADLGFIGTQPRRMIPFISWNQEEGDTTYQVYGDTYIRQETRKMFCKVDGSST